MVLEDIFPRISTVTGLVTIRPPGDEPTPDFWIWLRSLQGLVNRDSPHLYITRSPGEGVNAPRECLEDHWLEYYRSTFGLPAEEVEDVDAVLERYRHLVDGYVLYDTEAVIQTQNLAITRAGLESVLPVAPSQEAWMTRHGIPRRDDLRGKFADNWEAAEWAIDNLWPRCYRRLYANFCIHRTEAADNWYPRAHDLEDFVVYHRGMALDLPRCRVQRRSLYLYRRMLESAEAPGVQMNWHCCWEQEKEYVAEAALGGFFVLCSIATPNLTIHGGIGDPDRAYTQPLPEPETCRAEADKVYVCFYHTDGDATWAMNNLHSGNWTVPERGKFKFGWGFLPLMVRLMPGMLQYYWETKTENDCFWGPSSGAGYTYSHMWPEGLAEEYLHDTRRLLDQSGQNGCNMVNWFLQDWWREVEDEAAIRREQELLGSGPGLVCGLGGSPYARSYLGGPAPKLHSVHIANVGRDNMGDIALLAEECPTRPLFLFLFAQIAAGVWERLESQMDELARQPQIELLSLDEFFLTLRDAIDRGLVGEELYEKSEALAERWLKAPGRHRLPVCERLADELARVAHADADERNRNLADAGWTELVSREVEQVAADRDEFLSTFRDRTPTGPEEEGDALLYVAFTLAWHVVRAAIMSHGVYANHRTQCLDDFVRLCGSMVDVAPFEGLFDAWEQWEGDPPGIARLAEWCDGVAAATRSLRDHLGPDESEEFTGWPPRTI